MRITLLGWAIRFSLQRLYAQWRSLLMVMIGVLLACIIGANISLYTATVSQIGMIERLESAPPEASQTFSRISLKGKDYPELDEFQSSLDQGVKTQVETILAPGLDGWVSAAIAGLESAPVQTMLDDQPLTVRTNVVYLENWREQVTLVEGDFPAESASDVDFEAVLSVSAANVLDVTAGDVLILDEQGWETSQPARVRISGIVRENDPDDLYWTPPSPLQITSDAGGNQTITLLADATAAATFVTTFVPDTTTRLFWRVLFSYPDLSFTNLPTAVERLKRIEPAIRDVLEPPNVPRRSFVYQNDAVAILESYQEEVRRIGAPFNLLMLQLSALVLLFISVIITLARREERREIALLQGRGASGLQIIIMRGVEAFIICTGAGLVAPFIARALLVSLAPTILNVETLTLEITSEAFLYAAAAAIASFIVMLFTLVPVVRQPLISRGGIALRAETQTWWQRYYLDLIVMAAGFIGLWRLLEGSSTLIQTEAGESLADPLLLLAPTLLFIALGSTLLRVFPGLVALFARLVSTRLGLSRVLAGWQVSREPVHYARITLLLALAVGIGWFASSFQVTFQSSQSDRARYEVGADVRVMGEIDPALLAQPEVESSSVLARFDDMHMAINTVSLDTGDILAIEPESLEATSYWRDDFGAWKRPGEPFTMPPIGEPLPFVPERIGLWIFSQADGRTFTGDFFSGVAVHPLIISVFASVNLRDENGQSVSVPLWASEAEGIDLPAIRQQYPNMMPGAFFAVEVDPFAEPTGWVYMEADLTVAAEIAESLTFESISLSSLDINPPAFAPTWTFFLSDLTLFDGDDQATKVEWFNQEAWQVIETGSSSGSLAYIELPEQAESARPAVEGLQLQWLDAGENAQVLLSYNVPALDHIPALASASFLELNNLDVGLTFPMFIGQIPLQLEVYDTVTYFPTLNGQERPFLIVDVNRLQAVERVIGGNSFGYEWETWIKLKPGTDSAAFMQTLLENGVTADQIETMTQVLERYAVDPLAVGLIGLLFLSFLIVLTLSVICLLTYSILIAQARRIEFGVLQAIGVRPRKLIASVAIEQGLVFGIAAVLGGMLGTVLSDQVIPTLSNSSGGENSIPFVVQFEPEVALQYSLFVGLVLCGVLILSLMLMRRLSLTQSLRMGEE